MAEAGRPVAASGKVAAHGLLLLAVLLGGGSLVAFAAHLWAGSLGLVRLPLGEGARLALDAGLSLAFFLQHSVMVRRPFRERALRPVPRELHASLYAVVSGIVLLAVVVLWQASEVVLVEGRGPWWWLARGVFVLGMAGFLWTDRALRGFDAFGARGVRAFVQGRQPEPGPLVARGPYRWVRHPIYLFTLLLVWSCPTVTADRLLFNLLWTAWIVVGAVLEERDLVAELGEAYRRYQARVPMLLPLRRPLPGGREPA